MSRKKNTTPSDLALEYLDIESLQPYPGNPKEHDLRSLTDSITRFGFVEPIILNQVTGHILSGHGRVESLLLLKSKKSPPPNGVVQQDGQWLVPAVRISIPAHDEHAAVLALNKIVETGGWNIEYLARSIRDLLDKGPWTLRGTGFRLDEARSLVQKALPWKEDETTSHPTPSRRTVDLTSLQNDWQVQPGDIWIIPSHNSPSSFHILACADSRSKDQLSAIIKSPVNGIFTSPPYAQQRKNAYGGIPPNQYIQWCRPLHEILRDLLADDGSFFLNIKAHTQDGQRHTYTMQLVLALIEWGWKFIDELCWNKGTALPGLHPNRFRNAFEPIYHFSKTIRCKFRPENVIVTPKPSTLTYLNTIKKNIEVSTHTKSGFRKKDSRISQAIRKRGGSLPTNVLDIPPEVHAIGHPATFPIALPEFFTLAYSDPGDTWLDPFVGSGSTIIACERTARIGIGIDIVPQYIALALHRLSLLGLQPERAK